MKTKLASASNHLSKYDPVLAAVITKAGPCTIQPHSNYYQELVDSIISQQLSIKAAATIEGRFKDLFGGNYPTPEQLLATEHETLRSAGLSNAKCNYIRDLARHIVDKKIKMEKLNSLSNDEIIAELTAVKGIGEWTAHMFLMFAMGRLDILAVGDLGIRSGIQKLYGLPALPDAAQVKELAVVKQWSPYETVACWYIWRSVDS